MPNAWILKRDKLKREWKATLFFHGIETLTLMHPSKNYLLRIIRDNIIDVIKQLEELNELNKV